MEFRLKLNTALEEYSLHTQYGYAECPHYHAKMRPCGTWCALFRIAENGKSVSQGCGNSIATIFLKEGIYEKTTESSNGAD